MRPYFSRSNAEFYRIRLCFCLLFCCLLCGWNKTPAQYSFDSWTTDQGLPQNSIKAILQTRDGYLWMTTSDGLVRYDGVRFSIFNKGNSSGIRSNRFTKLFESSDGSLWIGTEDSGATRYREGAFVTFTIADGAANWVRTFREDAQIGLMALTQKGLIRWEGTRFAPYASEDAVNPMSPTQENSRFAYGDQDGFHVFDNGRYRTYTSADGLPDSKIISLREDQRGTLWFTTADRTLSRLESGKITNFALENFPGKFNLSAVHEDRAGNLWVGWNDGRLTVRQNGEWKTYEYGQGIKLNQISCIYEDREGTIWLGSSAGGLFRARRPAVKVFSTQDGLIGERVYPVLETSEGAVWLGVWQDGLYRLKDGNLTRYTRHDGFKGTIFTALFQDRTGNLWVGGTRLYRFENNRFKIHLDKANFNNTGIYAIADDRAGNLWLGTQIGLYKMRGNELQRFTTNDGLPHQTVQVIREDRAGNLWFGTIGGLCVLRSDGKFQSFTESDGLASNHIRAIYEDSEGVLWIGTYDGGISRFENGKFTNYTIKNGLFNNGAFQILEDAQGNFWISSNLGIYRISRREMNEFAMGKRNVVTSVSYGKEDGLLTLECNGAKQPAGVKTRDGRLWFPTQRGVAVIDPANISLNPHPPPVVIESAMLDRENIRLKDLIEVAPGKNNLEINYAGLSFIKPENVRFRYRLEGLEADWIEAGTRRTAYYSYLPPGNYVFRVIAANSDGVWNEEGAMTRIVVHPPFWRTWWFLILSVLSLGILIFALYERRIWVLRKAHAAQSAFSRRLIESQESERKRIAAELHDSLGQNLLVIKNRVLMALSEPCAPERAFAQLDEISGTVSLAIEEVRTIAHNLRPYQLDRLGLTLALEAIVKRVAQSSPIRFESEIDSVDDLFSPEEEINLYRIVQESLNNIVKHSEATTTNIKIKRGGQNLKLVISDNGKGFDFETNRNGKGGLGLTSIAERAAIINARYTLHSAPDEGTTLILTIDLSDKHDERNRQ